MVNARLHKKVRTVFFFASPRHFDFLNCKTKTSECLNANTSCLKITGNNKQRNPGVLPENLGRGVRPASQNPYPIYDQNL